MDWKKDLCALRGQKSALWRDKIYIVGGNSFMNMAEYPDPILISNSHMRILDFSKSFNLTSLPKSFETIQRLPDEIPVLKGHSFIAVDAPSGKPGSQIRMFGGVWEQFGVYNDDGTPSSGHRGNLTNRMWVYDLDSGIWDPGYVMLDDRPGEIDVTPSYTLDTLVTKNHGNTQELWIYGGFLDANVGYISGPIGGNYTYTHPGNQTGFKNIEQLYRYDISSDSSTIPPRGRFSDIPTTLLRGDRLDGEMVFVPAGEEGILVVLGGRENSAMQDIMVFDIASQQWYSQPTSSISNIPPSGRRDFCTTVASAPDGSSYNIYVYGGRDPPTGNQDGRPDMLVLSLPSFRWIDGPSGMSTGGGAGSRLSHTCHRVKEKYMVVAKGYEGEKDMSKVKFKCTGIDRSGVALFDMSTGEWTEEFNPQNDDKYEVPEFVYKHIGGSGNGGATMNKPLNGWASEVLEKIFQTSTTTSKSDNSSSESNRISNAKLGAILGAILGVIALLILCLWLLARRRRSRNAHLLQPPVPELYHDQNPPPVEVPSYYPIAEFPDHYPAATELDNPNIKEYASAMKNIRQEHHEMVEGYNRANSPPMYHGGYQGISPHMYYANS